MATMNAKGQKTQITMFKEMRAFLNSLGDKQEWVDFLDGRIEQFVISINICSKMISYRNFRIKTFYNPTGFHWMNVIVRI